ncbi:MAG TPA: histidine kinase, partial [Chitinophagaceae bacterium]|nr:histidine kinase [Chitinophagaceae bacterium]
NDGLLSYDGTRIHQYLKETHPGLPRNEIGFLFCDSRNRIWICTNEGLALMDEQRRIKRVILHDSLINANIDFCFEVEGVGMVVVGSRRTYILPAGKKNWEPFSWFDDNVIKGAGISNLRAFDKTSYMFVMSKKAMLVNFSIRKVLTDITFSTISSVCKLNANELLVTGNEQFELLRINIASGKIVRKYSGITDVEGNKIQAAPFASSLASNGIIYISTRSGGLIGFDPDKELFFTYRHNPLNKNTISSDILRWVFCHPNGNLMVTSTRGVNFTNLLTTMFGQHNNFIDGTGKITDGGFTGVAEDAKGNIWIKGLNNLFAWNPQTDVVENISLPESLQNSSDINTEAGTINRDDLNNMWVTYGGKGLAKFNAAGKFLQLLSKANNKIPTDDVRITKQLTDRMIMVGADNGLFMLHPETYRVDSFDSNPLLKKISKKRITDIMPDGDKVWIVSSPAGGAYCYDFKEKKLSEFTKKSGLSSDRVYCLAKDLYGNIYIGTYDGLNILDKEGRITVINKHNGLRHPRVENIVTDKQGKIWITNFNSLICYNPAEKSFSYFDQSNGVSNVGFVVVGNTTTSKGEIIFLNNGLLVVDPEKINLQKEMFPSVAVHRLYDDDAYEQLKVKDTVKLAYNNSKVTLYYLANTLITANRFFYRYKMQNLDTGWQQPTKNNQVTYNLKPGKYYFQIQTSYNETGWKENEIEIAIIVSPPWWQTWWFRTLAVFSGAAIVYFIFRRRIRRIKSKAAIKQQMAELEGKAIRSQMNPHFIFNSLNAIQECIVTEKVDAAYDYLSRFSKLLRIVLDNSDKNLIPLSSELETIQLYLSLESLRFSQSFNYYIKVDE